MSVLTNRGRLAFLAIIALFAPVCWAQVSPFGGLAAVQFFDQNGSPLTNGAAYFYQAGSSTQLATYSDSSGTVQNTNPVTFTSGGRAQIWLSTGSFYKWVLCSVSTDGPFCAGSHILAQADNVPGGVSGGSGSGCSPSCTGIFISSTASPATSGVLRLASADSVCFRNAAGSTNICLSKDANDLLTWAGGSLKLPEVGAPAGVAGNDILYADNTAHRLKQVSNGGASLQLVNAGQDINTSDFVTQWHFGSTATPLSGTAPTTGQYLIWNGTNIVGSTNINEFLISGRQTTGGGICGNAIPANCATVFLLVNAHTLTRVLVTTISTGVGCSVNTSWGVVDVTTGSILNQLTPTLTGVLDSGALSVAMTAGDQIGIGVITAGTGCSPFGTAVVSMTYQ